VRSAPATSTNFPLTLLQHLDFSPESRSITSERNDGRSIPPRSSPKNSDARCVRLNEILSRRACGPKLYRPTRSFSTQRRSCADSLLREERSNPGRVNGKFCINSSFRCGAAGCREQRRRKRRSRSRTRVDLPVSPRSGLKGTSETRIGVQHSP